MYSASVALLMFIYTSSITSNLVLGASRGTPPDFMDRVCESHQHFVDADIIEAFDGCVLSDDKMQCLNADDNDNNNDNQVAECDADADSDQCAANAKANHNTCKFIGNTNTRMCVNPAKHLEPLAFDDMFEYILRCSVSLESSQLCYWDDNDNLYDVACRKSNGVCDEHSLKCSLAHGQRMELERKFEERKAELKVLPMDYTNNVLVVVDGTSTRDSFERRKDARDPKKGTSQKCQMKRKSRNQNGNWVTHNFNLYEDYAGASFYWYGPVSVLNGWSAGVEVLAVANGAHEVVCRFIADATANGKYTPEEINIDVVGYSRGGYTAMEIVRKIGIQGCKLPFTAEELVLESKKRKKKRKKKKLVHPQIRFLGLYDPVTGCMLVGSESGVSVTTGLFGDYQKQKMPAKHVRGHIAIAYGNPKLGSRPYFNTAQALADDKKDKVRIQYFTSTHSGVGGFPGEGDYEDVCRLQTEPTMMDKFKKGLFFKFPKKLSKIWNKIRGKNPPKRLTKVQKVKGYGQEMEESESMRADMFIREQAVKAGVPLFETNQDYYNFDYVTKEFNPQQRYQELKQEL